MERGTAFSLVTPLLLPQEKLLECSVPRFTSSMKASQIFQEAPAAPQLGFFFFIRHVPYSCLYVSLPTEAPCSLKTQPFQLFELSY